MSVAAPVQSPLRRGACPGLSAPMRTGDGLLARLQPDGTMTLDQMAGLCAAARRDGNGVVEITSRGNIQVRGLTESSAPRFANDVAELGIAAHDGVPVTIGPLAGLDPDELVDADALAAELRNALAAQSLKQRLAPKISIAIDGGGALHLDALTADIRLRAIDTPDGRRIHVAIGGDAASAIPFSTIPPRDAVDTVVRLLDEIASHGPDARARDVIHAEATDAFHPPTRAAANPIGVHPLRDGTQAVGVGFAFGHSDATALGKLNHAARDAGAFGLRTSPGRALLVLGVAADRIAQFVDTAAHIGFIVDRADLRRRVVACAGAPVCASGEIPTRALAPRIAITAAPLLAVGDVIHVSGCAKSCAHHGPAALTAIGRAGQCDLLVDGALSGSCAVERLPQRLAEARPRGAPAMAEARTYIRDGAAIYQKSFAIIRAEADLSAFSAEEADVAVRMIHACGQVEAAAHIAFGQRLVTAARGALAGGAAILCDAEMVAHGVTRARLPAQNEVICTLRDARVPALAEELGTTRSAAALDLWGDRLGGAVVAIGNAPTALFRLIEMLDAGAPRPAAILGIPVGFVGAAESKDALAANRHGIPYLVVRGRIGGSAMTAAAVNALARSGA